MDLKFQEVNFSIEVRNGLREVRMVMLGEEDTENAMFGYMPRLSRKGISGIPWSYLW